MVAVTGSTGFIGSDVVARLLKQGIKAEKILLLVRRLPQKESSLLWRRLKQYNLEAHFEKLTYHICDFENPENLKTSLETLPSIPDVFIHMAAIIHASSEEKKKQRTINVDISVALAEWGVGRIKHFIFLSSAVCWGITLKPEVRHEKDFNRWLSINNDFSYFATKREAHSALWSLASRLRISLLCPSIVHGSLESEKSSRRHLMKMRKGTLKVAPAGGNNVVALERVSQAIVDAALSSESTSPYVQLLVGENLLYSDYFQRYVNFAQGKKAPKLWVLPFCLGYVFLAVFWILCRLGIRLSFLESLVQSSFFLFVESSLPLPVSPATDDALKAALL